MSNGLMSKTMLEAFIGTLLLIFVCPANYAQEPSKLLISDQASPPDLTTITESPNRMRPIIERFMVDMANYDRIYEIAVSPERFARMERFFRNWRSGMKTLDFDAMSLDAKIDYVLFSNYLGYRIRTLNLEKTRWEETRHLLPFADTIITLQENRRRMLPVDPPEAAGTLDRIVKIIKDRQSELAAQFSKDKLNGRESLFARAADYTEHLKAVLKGWHGYYNGYDPLFTWWTEKPFAAAETALEEYAQWLRAKPGGEDARKKTDVFGEPVGRDALVADLGLSMIPYSPEELIAIGKAEYAWCERELKKASHELGYGDDWLQAVEHVKNLHVEPGKQADMIRDMAFEAIRFVEEHELMTIPELAKQTWRMEMMSPERQLIAPFFLGGKTILISFPTHTMDHKDKLMSMRGNNRHFARATVHHELIPGHHMQGYINSRFNTHRRLFRTPFWGEGWPLHWEMLLWDLDFPQSPENRIGMLFWRTHRCARIIFSLSFHLGTMTPQECIDFLVEKVGHERANAIAEVRRSFEGDYGALYQAAYLVGGLQMRAMYKELVGSGRMTNREFHDAVIRTNSIPVEMVRARLKGQMPERDFKSNWRFYGEIKP